MKRRGLEADELERTAEEGQLFIGILLLLMPNGSRKELAARSGVSRRSISLYERGLRRPQRRTRERMADSINVDLSAVEALFPTFERLRASARGDRGDGGGGAGSAESLAQRIGEAVRERVTTETATIFGRVAGGREANSPG